MSAAPAPSRRPRILLPILGLPSFIRTDISLLSESYDVVVVPCGTARELGRALWALRRTDLLLCWFGTIRFLPLVLAARALGRPVLVIAGGYDVARLPEIAYGNMRHPVLRPLGRLLFRLASHVAAFSASAGREAMAHAGVPAEKLSVIPLGYDPPPRTPVTKEPFVLCVSNIDASTLHRKGLLTVARASALLPDVPFVIAGRETPGAGDPLRSAGGPALRLLGEVDDARLQDLFARAAVYVQPSLHEGFGSAVAEAMLHDVVPVVADRFALPEVAGPCGIYVDPESPADVARGIREALAMPPATATRPRAYVLSRFPLAARRQALLALVRRLLGPR